MLRYLAKALLILISTNIVYNSLSAGTCICKVGSTTPSVSRPQPGVTVTNMNYSEARFSGVSSRKQCKKLCKKVRFDDHLPHTPINYTFKP